MAEETEVVLTANTTGYEQSVNQATGVTNKLLDSVIKMTTAIDGAFKATGRAGQLMSGGFAAGLTAAGVAAGRLEHQMAQLNASMTMISKTSAEQHMRMRDYEKTVTNLRGTFGMTSQEAINLATQLNKLGQSSQNINELATSFTKLGAVTGEGPGQLAAAMTQLQRTMGTEGVQQTKNFNASLAQLSQNAGVSATAVLQFGQAIAPIAKVSGMTQKEVMGVSTAFNKAGADGYAAANVFTKVATDINKAITTGSPQLQAYADTIGVTVDQLKAMSRVDVMTGFFDAINKQGPQALKTLERFGMEGVRNLRSIQAVAGSGTMREQVQTAIGKDPKLAGRFNESADSTFEGLNAQMNKMAENVKMIGEAFGKGVLPILEGIGKAVNMILSPINLVLQSLGKLPGGFAMAGVAALAFASTAIKAFTGISTFGLLRGAAATAWQGMRSHGLERAMLSGGSLAGYSQAERNALMENRNFRAGRDYVGSPLHHQMYGAYGRVGDVLGRTRDSLGNAPSTARGWLQARGVGLTQMAGQLFRSGLDPLSMRAMRNNFDRDPAVQMAPRADIARALGWQNVNRQWHEMRGRPMLGPEDDPEKASRGLGRAMNQAADSTRRLGTISGQAGREFGLFGRALTQATINTARYGGRGLAIAGGAAIQQGGAMALNAGRGFMGAMGGPWGLGIMAAGMAGMGIYSQWKGGKEQQEAYMADNTNTSPFAVYATAVGEAAAATKSFAQVLKEATAAGVEQQKWSAKADAATIAAAKKEGYTNKLFQGASNAEVRSMVGSTMARNPSDNAKRELQADLLRRYGTDAGGQKIVEDLMRQNATVSSIDLTAQYKEVYDAQQAWKPFKVSDRSEMASKSVASQLQEVIASGGGPGSQMASQATIAGLNELIKSNTIGGGPTGKDSRVRTRQGIKSLSESYVRGILGKAGTPEDIDLIGDLLMKHHGSGGDGNPAAFQKELAESKTPIGRAFAEAQANAGPGFNMMTTTMPNTRSYTSGWQGVAGLDQMALDRLRGVSIDRSLSPGKTGLATTLPGVKGIGEDEDQQVTRWGTDYQPGELNKVATAIFGSGGTGGPGSAVQKALGNEADVAAQWTAMKALSDTSVYLTQNFGEASVALDEITAAAGGAATQLGAMAQQARARTRQAQSEEMGYMTTAGRGAELFKNYRASLAADISRPSEVTGAHREEDRAAAEAYKQEQFQRTKSMVNSMREFNISREQQEEDYQRQRGYAEEDFNRQRDWSFKDYTKNRLRQEENFQHQVEQMQKQTAKNMTNIYEKQHVDRTWDAANLFQNMMDQQEKLAQHQSNLATLRKAGLSNDTIEQMGLNDPAQMQQAARLADDLAGDPKLAAAFNKAATERMRLAGKIVKDESNTQWEEMRYSFKRSMDQGEEDYKNAMDRQAIMFEESMDRQAIAYDEGMDRAADAFQRGMTEVTGTFEQLQKEALDGLSGTAKEQMQAVYTDINSISTTIVAATGSTAREVNALFQSLGISTSGTLTTPNGGRLMTGTIKVGGQTVNAGQFAGGGEIPGRSPHKKADNIPIMATAGEYMQPVDSVQYYGKDFMDAVREKKLPRFAEGGMVYQQMASWMKKNLPGVQITSSYRPGAITALGNVSMHAQGKALDVAPSMKTFDTILSAFGNKIWQLFYAPADGRTMLRGKPWKMDSTTKGDHWDHVHWAMQSMNGLAGAAGTGAGGATWDGTEAGLVKEIQKLASIAKFSKSMDQRQLYGGRAMGKTWLSQKIAKVGMALNAANNASGVDVDYSPSGVAGKGNAKSIVKELAAQRGWTGNQWNALDQLVAHESSWNPTAQNPSSTAYGLFQFLNSTWGSVGGHKTSDPGLQGQYGLKYISQRYGDPSKAWAFWNKQSPHWYGEGAVFGGKKQIGVGENGPEAVLPLNQRGVDFLFEVMKRNSSDSKRALVASGGVPMQGSTVSYYSRIDKSTQITGPITVQSQDPDDMIRKIQAKKALEALKGRH